MRSPLAVLSFVVLALSTSVVFAQERNEPWTPKKSDEPLVRVAARQLFKDYCEWDRSVKTIVLAIGADPKRRDPSPEQLRAFRTVCKRPVIAPAALPEPVEHTFPKEIQDPHTKKPAAQLTVADIDWKNPNEAKVFGQFAKSASFSQWVAYNYVRRGGSWKLAGTECYGGNQRRTVTGRVGNHTYRVTVALRPFALRRHRITLVNKEYDHRYLVDGQNCIGTDGNVPQNETATFEVVVDGRPWKVPRRVWEKYYEVHPSSMSVSLSKDGSRLAVNMQASDGAGGYEVTWFLRRNGRHTSTSHGIG